MTQVSTRPSAAGAQKLGITAARFGLDWSGGLRCRIDDTEVRTMLDLAAAAGVRMLDASSAYGEAEATLGATLPSPNPFRVMLRLRQGVAPRRLETAVQGSLGALWMPSADTLLADAADLSGVDGEALWSACGRLRDEGLFERIGFAASVDDDVLELVSRLRPDVVQLPVSLLDQRLVRNGTLRRLADMKVAVHLRAVFLHGLLLAPLERLPGRLKGSAARLKAVRLALADAGADPLAAGLRYALDRPEAACVWVGAAGPAELEALLAAAAARTPELDWSALALDDPVMLDPRRWAA